MTIPLSCTVETCPTALGIMLYVTEGCFAGNTTRGLSERGDVR